MPNIRLSGLRFSYTVHRKSTKSLSLRLKSKCSFVVNCHFLTPNFFIVNFINSHTDWILKNASRLQTKTKITDLKKLTILDIDYQLIINKSARDSVVIYEDVQKIYINTVSLTPTHLRSLLDKKLRPLALKLIKTHLSLLSLKFNFKYNHVSVRNQTSRFGSCSSKGNLNFNWQIIFFPLDKFHHILLHELNHLSIKDHSKNFWHQLAVYDPNSHPNNLWLKKEGTKLMLFS
jgi:predicted metal-dependent hydrolase